jgi:hypothetical protein
VDKSSAKSSKAPGKPFKKGDPRIQRGHGPKPGAPNSGRPPDWWKDQLREIRDRWLLAAVAKGVADDPDHPAWVKVGTWSHEQLEGKAKTSVDITSKGESLADLLTAIAKRNRETPP